jgi:ABC-type sugar transport system substrate-binding protein
MKFLQLLALMFCFIATAIHAKAAPLQVLMISPSYRTDPFFSQVDEIAGYAAESLGFELTLLHGDGNRLLQKQILEDYLKERKPDYLILQVYPGTGPELFEYLEQQQIPTITLEHLLLAREQPLVGSPGEKYKYWIGEIYHDNEDAGQLLMQYLLEACKPMATAGYTGVIGINGSYGFESDERAAGAKAAVAANPTYQLQQIVHGNWVRDVAYTQTLQLLRRYPQSRVIWSASDWMALGIIDGLKSQQQPLQNYCIGGFDWITAAVEKIQQGELTASVGGHFLMGAWAMVAIYDHHQRKLPNNLLSGHPAFALELLHKNSLSLYLHLLQQQTWQQIDFRQFSFAANPHQKKYPFSLKYALQILNGNRQNDDKQHLKP